MLLEPPEPGSWWSGRDAQNLDYWETNFPCRAACPVNTNAGGYVSLIAQGRYRDAYLLARAPNPLASICGRVCAHPCEAACRRQHIDQPIAIRAMKRVVTERFGPEASPGFEDILAVVERPRPRASSPRRIAVVGSGPAGLACAHDLALMGHRVTIFDAAPVAGGMMRLGIPDYRLPRNVLEREIEFIQYLGVEFRLGTEIGVDLTLSDLRAQYDAVFLAAGARKGKRLKFPGSDLPGVITALDFLVSLNLGIAIDIGERVVVVGGGNVAFDVARTARRCGGTSQPDEEHHNLAPDAAVAASRLLRRHVTLVSLEARDEMPADPEEIEEGSHEGVTLVHRRGPKAVLGDGRVRALQTVDVSRVFDEQGRFAPQFIDGSEKEIACDTVILAIGQVADLSFLGAEHGLRTSPQQTVVVDPQTLATSVPGVYAGALMPPTFLPLREIAEPHPDGCAVACGGAQAIQMPCSIEEWLSLAVRYRVASLLLQLPTTDVRQELRELAGELPDLPGRPVRDLITTPADEWEHAYHAALGPGGCPACESSYDEAAMGSRGPLLAEVSGFYRAFAFTGRSELAGLPDHAAVELDFLSYLAMKAAFALHQGCPDALEVTSRAFETFSASHPGFWMARFCDRLEAGDVPLYGQVGEWLRAALL